jgi:hypothetical protein
MGLITLSGLILEFKQEHVFCYDTETEKIILAVLGFLKMNFSINGRLNFQKRSEVNKVCFQRQRHDFCGER